MSDQDRPTPAPLTPAVQIRLSRLFSDDDRERAADLLVQQCGCNLPFCERLTPEALDRVRFAALKLSGGNINKLRDAVKLANVDWRDLLMNAGFGNDENAHRQWMP